MAPSVGERRVLVRRNLYLSVEQNKALVRRFLEARVETDLDALDEILAPDFVSHVKLVPGQQTWPRRLQTGSH